MGAYHKVLVAVDLNDEAISLVEKAKQQLNAGGELHILHVASVLAELMPVSSMGGSIPDGVDIFQKEYEEQAIIFLQQIAQKTALEPKNIHLVFGTEVRSIRRFAEDLQCQLLVIGVHKKKGLDGLLGSVAQGALRHAPCDVLTLLI